MTKRQRNTLSVIAIIIFTVIMFAGISFVCSGCGENPAGVPTQNTESTDNVPGYNTGPQVSVTDYNNFTMTYEYSKIWYAEGILNIEFPECSKAKYLKDKYLRPDGCGVAIPNENVKSYTTL